MVELGSCKLPTDSHNTSGTSETISKKDVASNVGSNLLQPQLRKRLHRTSSSIIREPYLTRKSRNQDPIHQKMSQNNSVSSDHYDIRNVQQYNVNDLNNSTSDRNLWSNNVAISQKPELTVSLTAIKHDHPLLSSGYDTMKNGGGGGYLNDGMLIGSLPPQTPTAINAGWQFNEIDKTSSPYCMPYGYCYDDAFLGQTPQKINDFADIVLPIPLEDEWILNNKLFSCDSDFGQQMWPSADYCEKPIKMEEVFQNDKMDLKSGPTLAELNSTGDVWDAIDLDELLASTDQNIKYNALRRIEGLNSQKDVSVPTQPLPLVEDDPKLQEHIDYLSSMLSTSVKDNVSTTMSSNKDTLVDSSQIERVDMKPFPVVLNPPAHPNTVLSNLLNSPSIEKPSTTTTTVTQAEVPEPAPATKAVPSPAVAAIVQETSSPSSRNRNNSLSTECSFSSHDEGFDSDSDDSDDESFYGDYEAKDLLGASTSDDMSNKWALNMGRSRKGGQQRYFWQYNVQSKGPKGTRISSVEDSICDPHVLCEASDPVFSPDCHVEGVKHAGKARRGDGNDLTPNPRKLLMIGLELKKLSKVINDLTPVAEVPVTARNRSRKEKNKLASRACRLKKKAQHEANKIKLFGLQQEHKKLMSVLIEVRKSFRKALEKKSPAGSTSSAFDQIVAQKGPPVKVAGKTTEFVNNVLDNVASGISNGGLDKV